MKAMISDTVKIVLQQWKAGFVICLLLHVAQYHPVEDLYMNQVYVLILNMLTIYIYIYRLIMLSFLANNIFHILYQFIKMGLQTAGKP
jgi:hypothetical protein